MGYILLFTHLRGAIKARSHRRAAARCTGVRAKCLAVGTTCSGCSNNMLWMLGQHVTIFLNSMFRTASDKNGKQTKRSKVKNQTNIYQQPINIYNIVHNIYTYIIYIYIYIKSQTREILIPAERSGAWRTGFKQTPAPAILDLGDAMAPKRPEPGASNFQKQVTEQLFSECGCVSPQRLVSKTS